MATANETTTKRGFHAPCPRCLESGCVRVDLGDLDVFTCAACDETFEAEAIRGLVAGWSAVLQWIDTAPVREG